MRTSTRIALTRIALAPLARPQEGVAALAGKFPGESTPPPGVSEKGGGAARARAGGAP